MLGAAVGEAEVALGVLGADALAAGVEGEAVASVVCALIGAVRMLRRTATMRTSTAITTRRAAMSVRWFPCFLWGLGGVG
jgi:hypothetical protein